MTGKSSQKIVKLPPLHQDFRPARAQLATTMRIASIAPVVVALTWLIDVIGGAPIHAHDWYPVECCAQHDCVSATAIEGNGRGGMTVIVGDRRIPIPQDLTARPSIDSRIHVCFRMYPNEIDGNTIITPVCLFLPAQT